MDIIKALAEEFKLREEQVAKTVEMIDNGDTIPFIARYRKEVTGSLDDAILRDLNDRLEYLRNIEKRKEEVSNSITEQGKMTDEIRAALEKARNLAVVARGFGLGHVKLVAVHAAAVFLHGKGPLVADGALYAVREGDVALDVHGQIIAALGGLVQAHDEAL